MVARRTPEDYAALRSKHAVLDAFSGATFDLVERVARLNPDAGEIGAGMLADLVQRARAIKSLVDERMASGGVA